MKGIELSLNIQTENAVIGIVKRNPKGFCFVNVEQENDVFDVFIPPEFCKTNYTGDKVKIIYTTQDDGRLQGQVIETLEENRIFYGIVKEKDGIKYCISDSDSFILKDQSYENDHIIKIKISPKFQSYKTFWVSEVEKEFGDVHSEFIYQKVALDKFDVQQSFNKMCKKQVSELMSAPTTLSASNSNDLTHLHFFTIDSETTKDIDDAICFVDEGVTQTLYVAIANVADYIPENSALDKTAKERVSTIYMPGMNIPMFPRELSENLFSLNPHVKRQAVVGIFTFENNQLIGTQFKNAVIQSKERLSYSQVDQLITTDTQWQQISAFIQAIRKDGLFDRANYSIETDDKGFMTGLYEETSTPSQQIVETCMLLYNQKTAEWLSKCQIQIEGKLHGNAIFRVQGQPETEYIEKLNQLFSAWGIDIDVSQFSYETIQHIIAKHEGDEHVELIMGSIMRSLPKSEYSGKNEKHFSLNYEAYAQATSPIRRYVDLINQRELLAICSHKTRIVVPFKHSEYLEHIADTLAMQGKLVNYVESKLKIDFMSKQVETAKAEYAGVVANTTMRGISVKVAEIDLNVFVPMKELTNKTYKFNSQKLCWEKEGRILKVGTKLTIKLSNLNHFSYPELIFD